jgi:16S rRNA (adenine1518-N6/adenine1519-N6)-dimethyltransferase
MKSQPHRQKKSLSQVFLHTDWPCVKICELLVQHGVEQVLEIGPGKGILTRKLVEAGLEVTAVEKDDDLAEYMGSVASRYQESGSAGSLTVVNEDILKFDISQWVQTHSRRKAICGNIPYNISSPILMHTLPELTAIEGIFFLVQLEFAKRLCSPVNEKSYGSLSVYTQLRAKTKVECKVERACFYPVPKVDSAVISLLPPAYQESPALLKQVEQLTRQVFHQRRKKLSNSLGSFLHMGKVLPEHIDLSRRCDTLSPQEFIEIAKVFL